MFKQDKWGNTYFFIDHDFNYDQHQEGPNLAPGGSYLEIARCLNFFDVQKRKKTPLSPIAQRRRCLMLRIIRRPRPFVKQNF